ncbi:unnamed protein product [Spirodela intermedia]|uniref:Dof zinc finger protein n=1 Tax=Spirodela intermedia TaxID=51605 RepID=A0A7I8JBL7_SPIIN|nr:unnamed protein product [Spirodela intermedia]CAA6667489.1 unnamed protein product [Spirodela intermedia]
MHGLPSHLVFSLFYPALATNSDQQNLRCPRCDSTNTKFCYYNNYNLTQPRHFCKTCRRYWTKGGALRNVPIGGGCRKAKTTGVSVGPGGQRKPRRSLLQMPPSSSPAWEDEIHGQHHADHPAKSFGNAGPPPSSTTSSSPGAAVAPSSSLLASTAASGPGVLETATLVGGEFGYWSSPFAWADMSTTNGSFP